MSVPSVYVREKDGLALFGNSLVGLAFCLASKGAVVSIIDKVSGYQ